MIKETEYHPDWQHSRIDFIHSKYPIDFFKGKRVLELGAHNGYIGAYFASLGAEVHCVEGRQENVDRIKSDYPNITSECFNLDTPEWKWGNWDIIINFGLYYHLEKYHTEHLINCIDNCDLMFFETVIYDSFDSEIYFRHEEGIDQSLSNSGGTPSTKFVEDIFEKRKDIINYKKYSDKSLNAYQHNYDWIDLNTKLFPIHARRFWIINKK